MPTVPRRSVEGPQLQPIQQPQMSGELPGSAAPAISRQGEAMRGLGDAVAGIFIEEARKANDVAAVDFDNKVAQLETDLLYHPEHGAMNTKGKNAMATYDSTMEAYRKGTEKLVSGAANKIQADSFKIIAEKRRLSIDRALQQHMAVERRAWAVDVGNAKAESARQLAVAGRYEIGRIDSEIENANAAIAALSVNAGLDEAVTKNLMAKSTSNIHSSVVEAMLADNSPLVAEKYFKEHRDQIVDTDQLQTKVSRAALEFKVSSMAMASVSNPANRQEDGMVDLPKAVEHTNSEAKKMGLDAIQTDMAIASTMSHARISDAQNTARKEADDKSFFERSVELQQRGVPFEQAKHQLFQVQGYSRGITDTEALGRLTNLQKLYARDESYYDDALTKMDSRQKLAWEQIQIMAKSKLGDDQIKMPGSDDWVKASDAFLLEMKHSVIGMSPTMMLDTANKSLEKMPKPGTWFSKQYGFEASYEQRVAKDAAMAKLEADPLYGPARVRAAETLIKSRRGIQPSPVEIKALLDSPVGVSIGR